jgi:hypothetical protein
MGWSGVASGIDVQEAFRRGVRGAPFDLVAANGLAEAPAPFATGANEGALLALSRMAGLTDAHGAYETGRALRLIVQLFDRAGAPERVGRQFLDNLAGAVVIERMRGRARPWGAADTVDMFAELYARVLGSAQGEIDQIRRAVMDYAVGERPASNAVSTPWYRRPA